MRSLIFLLILILATGTRADELPGGEVQVRPSLVTEKGGHPRIVVQTVPDAGATATCLVMRYTAGGSARPPAGAAHLLEHLLFRTRPNGKPGALLVRNETLGDSSKAWVTPTSIVFSELVPADHGLQSLQLQLDRLKGVPKDKEGLALEKGLVQNEIAACQSAEEKARRAILQSLGLEPFTEGTTETLKDLDLESLGQVFDGISLEEDVVIAVVGPHTAREVRQALSASLEPLAPARRKAREKSPTPAESTTEKTLKSALSQTSYFFEFEGRDPRVARVAESLARVKSGKTVRLEREDGKLLRLDLPSDIETDVFFQDLTPAQAEQLLQQLRREWFGLFESQQARAEMLAFSELNDQSPEMPVTEADLPLLVEQAKTLLKKALETDATLTLEGDRPELYQFKTRAYRTETRTEQLPNGMEVTVQTLDSFPIVAVSGFFRISPSLDSKQIAVLESFLSKRESPVMSFEVKPSGIFFHHWAPSEDTTEALKACASELKELSRLDDFKAGPEANMIDDFFIPAPAGASKRLKGSKLFKPENAHLVVVGAIEQSALDQGLRPAWSGWFSDKAPAGFSPPSPKPQTELPVSRIIPMRAGSSPALILGFIGPGRSSQDFLAFNLAIQTLAGRPNTNLLARKLEHVTSVKVFPLPASETVRDSESEQVWLIAIRASKPWSDPEALAQRVGTLLKDLGKRPLAESELERTREYLKSSLTLSSSTPRGRARVLAHAEFYRLSKSYAEDFAGLYDHLSPELVMTICKGYLEPAQVRWLYFKPDP